MRRLVFVLMSEMLPSICRFDVQQFYKLIFDLLSSNKVLMANSQTGFRFRYLMHLQFQKPELIFYIIVDNLMLSKC